jgi:hypothetical protein
VGEEVRKKKDGEKEYSVRTTDKQNTTVQEHSSIIVKKGAIIRTAKGKKS